MSKNGVIRVVHTGSTGTSFGAGSTTPVRFQTFFTPTAVTETVDLQVKIRRVSGAPASAVYAQLYATQAGLPVGDALALGLFGHVSDTFSVVGCSFACTHLTPGREYALVLASEPMANTADNAIFEWCSGPVSSSLRHGYQNGTNWIKDSGNTCHWLQIGVIGGSNTLEITHSATSGFSFGQAQDQVKRFQTFIACSERNITGIDLKVRKLAGTGHSDITVELFKTASHLPTGSPVASAVISASKITTDWREINAPLHCAGLIAEKEYAIVVGQRTPASAVYEWATTSSHDSSRFGKWTGSTWVDESSLGDGWMKIWQMPTAAKGILLAFVPDTVRGFGFGNSADEIKRYQTFSLSGTRTVSGIDLRLRKFGTAQASDIRVEIYATSNNCPTGSALAAEVIPSGAIGTEWTIVHARLRSGNLSAGTYAIVLSQLVPAVAHYEWATGTATNSLCFGKWNGSNWVDESSLGDAWLRLWGNDAEQLVNCSHTGTSGYGFGNSADELQRYQTFIAPANANNAVGYDLNGVQVKLRKIAGSAQSDIIACLYDTANQMPTGFPKTMAVISSGSVGTDWTLVNVPLYLSCEGTAADLIPGRTYAIVLSQRYLQDCRYEWAAANVSSALQFGKYNGSSWINESGLGDGWLKVSLISRIRPILPLPRFSPCFHGFQFENNGFANDVIPALDYRTNALCGGMAYAALDYYNTRTPVPDQPFRPAPQTVLRGHIYNRQVDSITNNLDRWSEFVAGLDLRNTEFFNWGITCRITELRQYLDQGIACVICLMGGNGWGHQVVAFDYTLGRYQSDLGNYADEFKIYVYDPNHRNCITTIVANRNLQVYQREHDASGGWRTYFVDGKYVPKQAPSLPNPSYAKDGLVHELALEFGTATDDLRGGNDNINLDVSLTDGSVQHYPNINLGGRWVVGSDEYARVVLTAPFAESKLREINLRTTFAGGVSGDNWDMTYASIHVRGGDFFQSIKSVGKKWFSCSDNMLAIEINPIRSIGLSILAHLQGTGDTGGYMEDEYVGTQDQARQLEGFQISITPPISGLGLRYFAHVQSIGDTSWVTDGQFVGTRGKGLRVEGFAIETTGPLANQYVVEYLAHVLGQGYTPFYSNGAYCGTRGQGLRVEGIRVRVFKKA